MNYYFEDFTETNYKTILQRLLHKGYEFIKFDYEKIKWGGVKPFYGDMMLIIL